MMNFRVMSPLLLKKASVWIYHRNNLFNFDWVFLKLADKLDMDEFSDEF